MTSPPPRAVRHGDRDAHEAAGGDRHAPVCGRAEAAAAAHVAAALGALHLLEHLGRPRAAAGPLPTGQVHRRPASQLPPPPPVRPLPPPASACVCLCITDDALVLGRSAPRSHPGFATPAAAAVCGRGKISGSCVGCRHVCVCACPPQLPSSVSSWVASRLGPREIVGHYVVFFMAVRESGRSAQSHAAPLQRLRGDLAWGPEPE